MAGEAARASLGGAPPSRLPCPLTPTPTPHTPAHTWHPILPSGPQPRKAGPTPAASCSQARPRPATHITSPTIKAQHILQVP